MVESTLPESVPFDAVARYHRVRMRAFLRRWCSISPISNYAVIDERPLDWVGSSKRDFLGFPDPVKNEMGNALGLAQFGGKHPSAKPWKGRGPGVF